MAAASGATSPWEDRVAFEACCSFFEKVARDSNKKQKLTKLVHFLRDCRVHQSNEETLSSSLFPIMRLILPQLDRERGAYGIKESVLAKLYIDFLRLGPTSSDAIKLKNYRAPKSNQSDAGDFAAVLFSVIKDRHYENSKMSVGEVNSKLDEIVRVNANEGRKGVERVLMELFKKMNGVQQKWLVRIILKDMKLGIGQASALKIFHPDANDLFDVNANLKKVCEMLRDPNVRRNEIEIQLFNPFKPMLAERCPMKDVIKTMGNKQFYIEVKYDGERMQLHKEGKKFQFFSRNGFDFTDDFGHSSDNKGKFCSYLADSLLPSVNSIILDGEICAFNHQTGTLTQKGEQMNIRSLGPDHLMYQQCLYVYDIVYLNGEVLTNKPLKNRLEILPTTLREMPGRVQFADRRIASTRSEIAEALNDAIDRREEGIVLKDPDSVYKPNVRTKGGWVKIKPEYSGSLMDQCDLIIMGGYFGSGKRGGGIITHFLLGLAVKQSDQEVPTQFHSFCRVGSGYSMQELFDLLQKLQPHFKKSKPTSSKFEFILEYGREKPDVYIDPRQSVLLQVKAAEIVNSDVYKTGCTLRFPRVEKVRYDKSWHDCMTVTEMESLRKQGEGKLFNRHMLLDDAADEMDDDSPAAKRRRRMAESTPRSQRFGKTVGVSSLYRAADLSHVMVETHNLNGKVIVVEPCNESLKRELEEIVRKHGGTCEQNVTNGRTFCYVETGFKIRAKNVVKSGKVNVVKSSWLLDCKEKFRAFRPSDMIFTTPNTLSSFGKEFDQFGDSYTDRATEESLRFSMARVSELGEEVEMSREAIAEFESKYFATPYKFGLFRQFLFYVDKNLTVGDPCTAVEFHPLVLVGLTLQFYGGEVVERVGDGITHVIVHTSDVVRLEELKEMRRKRKKKFHIVSEEWVESCVKNVELLEERNFDPQH